MKFCIAFMFQNEADWLKLHLPVLLQSEAIDGIVAIDGGSTDGGADYINSLGRNLRRGAHVRERKWDWKPLGQENAVIEYAEELGYEGMLLTAPDELWWPEHISSICLFLERDIYPVMRFPTYNFTRDRGHVSLVQPYYPDSHVRAWRLDLGIRHVGELDSVPAFPEHLVKAMPYHMYHYSHIKPRDWYTLKGTNFHLVKNGLRPLKELPEGTPLSPFPPGVPFEGKQPLDPAVCGLRAPYRD